MDRMVSPAPDITVLVRSTDRPSLARAVRSALAQEGVSLRVCVLAAHGGPLLQIGTLREDPRVQVLEPGLALPRSAAANACLEAVKGGLALFLDDDDWLLPGHLQGLSQALQAQPEAVAAYTGVRVLGGDPVAPTQRHVFDQTADRLAMQLQNALPIHAVLFRKQAQTPCFDETLDHFEDWDFWLRLMAQGAFVQVPGISAVYWLDEAEGSGHASAGPQRQAMLARFAQRRLEQWQAADVVGLIERQAQQSQALEHGRQRVAALQTELSDLAQAMAQAIAQTHARAQALEQQVGVAMAAGDVARAEAARLAQDLAEHRRELTVLEMLRNDHLREIQRQHEAIQALLASTSWRVTRPLRAVGKAVAAVRSGRLTLLLRNFANLARGAVRRHGLRGVLARVPHYLLLLPRVARECSRPAAAVAANPFAQARAPRGPVRLHPELRGTTETLDAMVSVVIPTLNGGDELVNLVRKLLGQQALRAVEVVVVDSGSRDGSDERAEAAGARVVRIRPEEFSHSHARNVGADHATGTHLVFMVQDAYPIGDLWLYGLLRYLIDHREQGVVAASCSEYCRSDSDAMYDCGVNTHYRFLGCLEEDRIGHHIGDDHMSLRAMGQLSDVACMIPRDLFMQYRYRGDYAEDLDLGIRLIQAGHKVAMLASVKVVHSHNRPAWYYLKRSFVDVIFLVGLFKDFECPPCRSVQGLMAGIRLAAEQLSAWLPVIERLPDGQDLGTALSAWIASARTWAPASASVKLRDERLDAFLTQLGQEAARLPAQSPSDQADAQRAFLDAFLARLDHFNRFASAVYGPADARLRQEFADAARKTLAATVGAALAYWVLDLRRAEADAARMAESLAEREWAEQLFKQLKAGV